jgi:8-oxo-dGTP pyrophosphatase MutT (NUDIX family)
MLEPQSSSPTAAARLSRDLAAWSPQNAEQDRLRAEFIRFVDEGSGGALARDSGPTHVTASCFVFTADLLRVLLCFHRKGQFWVQLGGHIEASDPSAAHAAFREAREEGGISALTPVGLLPVDVDRHSLGDGFGRCREHWDIGFAAIAPSGAIPTVSAESEDVAWWPLTALPTDVPRGFAERVGAVAANLKATAAEAQAAEAKATEARAASPRAAE